jgi:hypothetical protein
MYVSLSKENKNEMKLIFSTFNIKIDKTMTDSLIYIKKREKKNEFIYTGPSSTFL